MDIFYLKDKAINAIGAVDLSKLSLNDMKTLAETLKMLDEIKPKDTTFEDALKEMKDAAFNGYKYPTLSDLV